MLFISLSTFGKEYIADLEGKIHNIHSYSLSFVQTYSKKDLLTKKGKIYDFFGSTVLNMHERKLEFLYSKQNLHML